jgi:phosphopantothenoylcysteine decarboxylase/phosphopantothenate--cysteine ligase
VIEHAKAKRAKKGCDWILANDVAPATGTFGGAKNRIHMIDDQGVETWPEMTKTAVAAELAERIAEHLAAGSGKGPAVRRGETAA